MKFIVERADLAVFHASVLTSCLSQIFQGEDHVKGSPDHALMIQVIDLESMKTSRNISRQFPTENVHVDYILTKVFLD